MTTAAATAVLVTTCAGAAVVGGCRARASERVCPYDPPARGGEGGECSDHRRLTGGGKGERGSRRRFHGPQRGGTLAGLRTCSLLRSRIQIDGAPRITDEAPNGSLF